MKKKIIALIGLTSLLVFSIGLNNVNADNSFTKRIQAEDYSSKTGNIYIRSNGDNVPVYSPVLKDSFVLNGAEGGKYIDFSNPVKKFAGNDMYGTEYQLTDKYADGDRKGAPKESIVGDTATWKVSVPKSGFYKLSFKYNNPATRVKGYRNDRDERNCRIMINTPVSEENIDKFYTDSKEWAGWMIFNISGYNDKYNENTHSSLTPQTDNNYQNVIGNTKWNNNYMNVYLDQGENTVTLGIQAPPGQGVYDGPNLDYFDITYIGNEYVNETEIPYLDKDFQFEHPGIYYTIDDLKTMKSYKGDKNTVYGKGYEELKKAATASSSYIAHPQQTVDIGAYNNPNIGGTDFTKDGGAAHYNALMWYLDDDVNHAKKAIEILNGWASTFTTVGKGNDIKLRFALFGTDYLNAAEILKNIYNKNPNIKDEDKWQDKDIQKFELFIKKLLNTTTQYYPQANGNWDTTIGGFNMAAAVYLDNVDLFNDALTQFYLGNLKSGNCASMGSINNYIYTTGESQESSRDAVHARMGISGLAYQSNIAWNQGIDIYSAYDHRLLKGTLYNAQYLIGRDVNSKTFISDKSRQNSDISSMVFEIVGNHYANQIMNKTSDIETIYAAAEARLRKGNTKNGANDLAQYYGAMIFTDVKSQVDVSVTADQNQFYFVGDSVKLTAAVKTDSAIQSVRWHIPQELKQYVESKVEGQTLTLKLLKIPKQKNMNFDITASSIKNASVSKTYTLQYVEPTLSLDKSSLELNVGETTQLKATLIPQGMPYQWNSQDNTIVNVKEGTVTALKAGHTKIALTSGNLTAYCEVVVKEKKQDISHQANKSQPNQVIKTDDATNIMKLFLLISLSTLVIFHFKRKHQNDEH